MGIELRRAAVSEAAELAEFDKRIFCAADWFSVEDWKRFASFWIVVDGEVVGSTAVGYDMGVWANDEPPATPGAMFIASTGILPEHQGKGYGRWVKTWHVAHAREQGFDRIWTCHRMSNARVIHLSRSLGFTTRYILLDFYHDPSDDGQVMALDLR